MCVQWATSHKSANREQMNVCAQRPSVCVHTLANFVHGLKQHKGSWKGLSEIDLRVISQKGRALHFLFTYVTPCIAAEQLDFQVVARVPRLTPKWCLTWFNVCFCV